MQTLFSTGTQTASQPDNATTDVLKACKRQVRGIRAMLAERRRRIREELFQKQDGKCVLCGGILPPVDRSIEDLENPTQYPTLDHKIPTSKGGTNRKSNLQLVHSKCNNEKGDKIYEMDT